MDFKSTFSFSASPASTPALSVLPVGRRFRGGALGQWLAVLLFVGLPFIGANILTKLFMADPGLRDARNLIKVLVLMGAYFAYVRWWERRPVDEFSLQAASREFAGGLLLGGALIAAVVAMLALVGAYTVQSVGSASDFARVFTEMMPKVAVGAVIEELLFRLIALRLLERSVGTAWALLISSVLFGLAHLGNAGASPLIGLMLGIELGLLLGAAYVLTRRLWLCVGVHLAWNFVQGAVFGISVSGHTDEGWLRASLTGPDWLSGGTFGVEGSAVSLLLCLLAAGVLWVQASRRGQFKAR
ncbi:CPBP family intramembrane glutamic endopeptidase [Roseateles sp.]|uniref:CPBP family intramembrane glutamic endopeptidase n=1 Tax=Roseateles sp. TaxID=1971397 RepID=UPI003BA57B7F